MAEERGNGAEEGYYCHSHPATSERKRNNRRKKNLKSNKKVYPCKYETGLTLGGLVSRNV
jgi:hypothetical protein